ncbi:Clavaminate synthase-like protein, partial [Zopfia rhizophila CBS 207.26]
AIGLNGDEVKCHNFPLPRLRHYLHDRAVDIHEGRGFFVLRGMRPQDFSAADNLVIFLGIASYIAQRFGKQDPEGNMLSHIIDTKKSSVPREQRRGIHSNTQIDFHNEIVSDILGLQIRQTSKHGGELLLSPAWSMYNDLALHRPDVLRLLSEPVWPAQIPLASPSVLRSLLFSSGGKIILNMDRGPMDSTSGDPKLGTKPLSTAQLEALNAVDTFTRKHYIEIRPQAGDLVFVNNFSIMHSRRAFIDEGQHNRHVLRLWLRNDDLGWPIPKALKSSWSIVFDQNEKHDTLRFPVEPKPSYKRPRIREGAGSGSAHLVPDESEDDE